MRTVLLIGGNGFIGYHVLKRLVNENVKIRSVDRTIPEQEYSYPNVDYRIGDIWERDFLEDSIKGVDIVLDFVSTTMPSNKEISLETEINRTLRYHDYILSTMTSLGVKNYIFPSSGGAVYGSRESEVAVEDGLLQPTTPYGAGKKLAEDVIHYYSNRCGLSANILRISNVYGSQRFRDRPQGVIDVFVQNAIEGKPIVLWGNASTAVRDYVYLDDVAEATKMVMDKCNEGVNTYNIGTGIGTSVAQVVKLIEAAFGCELTKEYRNNKSSGVDRIVLSNKKIFNEIGWQPRINLIEGIRRTIEYKKKILRRNDYN